MNIANGMVAQNAIPLYEFFFSQTVVDWLVSDNVRQRPFMLDTLPSQNLQNLYLILLRKIRY